MYDRSTPTLDHSHRDFMIPEIRLQAAQKALEARRAIIDEWRRILPVRWSEAIERNEAYEAFSAAGSMWAAARDNRDSQREAVLRLMIPLLTALFNSLFTSRI